MRIAIIGLGGVGGYFGGRLTQTQHDVVFIARGAHLAAINAHGLRVDGDAGQFVAQPQLATDDAGEVGTVDVVIVATKAWQVREAAEAMRPLVGSSTTIVPLLNGVDAPQQLADVYGDQQVLGGFCRVLSHISQPGHIIQSGVAPLVAFGERDGRDSDRVALLREAFVEAGIDVAHTPDIVASMWQKFLFIAAFSGIGAVTRAPIGAVRTTPESRQLLQNAMIEVRDVATAHAIALSETAVSDAMAMIDRVPPDALASMQRDIMDGRPSELEYQSGAVVRYGAAGGVATPIHRFIYSSLLPTERIARGLG